MTYIQPSSGLRFGVYDPKPEPHQPGDVINAIRRCPPETLNRITSELPDTLDLVSKAAAFAGAVEKQQGVIPALLRRIHELVPPRTDIPPLLMQPASPSDGSTPQ